MKRIRMLVAFRQVWVDRRRVQRNDAIERCDAACRTHTAIVYYKFVRRASVLLGLLTILFSACYRGSRPPRIGTAAPDFVIQDGTQKVTLSEFRGKVVVLNFWATWCPPCVEEMPSLVQLQHRMADKGVQVVGVSVDVDEDGYRRFLSNHKIDFLTIRDPDQKANSLYGTFKFPETYIIDRDGVFRSKFVGPVDWSQPQIVDFLAKL
jgi:cytochrome c biogenesis protein CcmG, thiol:disulfide interchange protein DsbE